MIGKYSLFTILYFYLFAFSPVLTAQEELQPLPIDPLVRYGKLHNGLTYYIRHNARPEQAASFYLVQSTGSLQEEENQRGLAHFVEHLAFKGTKHFPERGMDRFIESLGLRTGQDFNAYTSLDKTVYMITDVPVRVESIIDSSLLILHDWSTAIAMADTSIEKERCIIREEWHSNQDAQARLWQQQLPRMYPGSRYANRQPIGNIHVIDSFRPDELRDYYKKWYRPDLQAVIIVGDIAPDKMEMAIKRTFYDIPKPTNTARKEKFNVPDNFLPLISIAKDKEATDCILQLFYKHEKLPDDLNCTVTGLVKDYIQTVCSVIMNERFDRILHQANPPFVYAEARDGDFMIATTQGAWTVTAITKENEIETAMTSLVNETERIKQYGFTVSEYDRAHTNILKRYETAYNDRDMQNNTTFATQYAEHFISGGAIPGIAMEYSLIKQIAPTIPVEQVNSYIQDMLQSDDNIVISLTGPDKNNIVYPSDENLLRAFLKAQHMPVEPFRETVSNEPLIPLLPAPDVIARAE